MFFDALMRLPTHKPQPKHANKQDTMTAIPFRVQRRKRRTKKNEWIERIRREVASGRQLLPWREGWHPAIQRRDIYHPLI
ncbi:hypothetical protein PROFUN_05739 [Planoprotostelium fungivorum]|uniref:Uncharacterized protein n=1 Tax=Planoprotostelium fungivorum TaxID=1890364 RepID=A0A2P6NQI6_9EUKA|nr:hypothetical protein PROFUN_05739 [Planoprotostelium fungivorum]